MNLLKSTLKLNRLPLLYVTKPNPLLISETCILVSVKKEIFTTKFSVSLCVISANHFLCVRVFLFGNDTLNGGWPVSASTCLLCSCGCRWCGLPGTSSGCAPKKRSPRSTCAWFHLLWFLDGAHWSVSCSLSVDWEVTSLVCVPRRPCVSGLPRLCLLSSCQLYTRLCE